MTAKPSPPAAPDDRVGLVRACRRLHAAIDRLDEAAARAAGISRNDLRCLNLLEAGSLSPKALAQSLGLTSGSVTALLDRLEGAGLVLREPHPEDRRALLVRLTPRAFERLAPIYRAFGQSVADLAEGYGPRVGARAAQHLLDLASACEAVVAAQGEGGGLR